MFYAIYFIFFSGCLHELSIYILLFSRAMLSDTEKRRIAKNMDMSPISQEYERELRRPIQNIVSGRIARVVLIQLQFVKKELLVAMQAIDELFNANQVNLQIMAITPAVLSVFLLQRASKMIISAIVSSSRGKSIESSSVIYRDLRLGIRELEKLFYMTSSASVGSVESEDRIRNTDSIRNIELIQESKEFLDSLTYGKMMSILHRLHSILVLNSTQFTQEILRLLQEDLRDLSIPKLKISQRILLLERISRTYPFLQNGFRGKPWLTMGQLQF